VFRRSSGRRNLQRRAKESPTSTGAKTISQGDFLPMDGVFQIMGPDELPKEVTSCEFFAGKKVILVTLPAAFSPTCSLKHFPGFLRAADEGLFAEAGVDAVYILSVENPYVLDAWQNAVKRMVDTDMDGSFKKAKKNGQKELKPFTFSLLSDGDGSFAQKLGLALDTGAFGGVCYRRASLLVEDGKVKMINVEDDVEYSGISGAEHMLAEGLGCKDDSVFLNLAKELGLAAES